MADSRTERYVAQDLENVPSPPHGSENPIAINSPARQRTRSFEGRGDAEDASRSRQSRLGLLLVAVIVGGGLGFGGWLIFSGHIERTIAAARSLDAPATRPPAVTLARVERRKIVETVSVTGTLAAREEVLVGAEVDGLRIMDLLMDVGDRVEAGQVLARLDHKLLDVQLAQTNANIAKAEAAIAQAKASTIEAQASAAEADAALKRSETLHASGNVSLERLLSRQTQAKVAMSKVAAAEGQLRVAEADKAFAVAQRDEIELRIARSEIRAPAAGVVSQRAARVGEVVGAATGPLFRLIRDGEVEFHAEVAEAPLSRLGVGQLVEVRLAGFDGTIQGRIRLIDPTVDPTSRLARVVIALSPHAALRPGAFARGTIGIDTRHSLTVPLSAVFFGADGAFVQAVKGDVVELRPVKTGFISDGRAEILAGLASREEVVMRAGGFVRSGDRITPIRKATGKVGAN